MKYDAIVLGYGPVGAVAVNMLAQRGWKVAVVERMADVFPLPRAIGFDGETARTFQEMGLMDTIAPTTQPGHGAEFLNAEGERVIGFDVADGELGMHRHPDLSYFHQPTLERILRDAAAGQAQVDVFLECEAGAPVQTEVAVTLPVTNLASGEAFELTGGYLLAADGAASPVRKHLGFKFESLGYDCQWLVVDAYVKDRTGLALTTQQHCNPERLLTFVSGVGELVRWEICSLPGETEADMLDEDFIWNIIGRWVSRDNAEVQRAAVYQFHAATADHWSQGRIFLLGDAVHQTPPFLGQGMVAGIRDVVNLVWKLQMVREGRAPAKILETYGPERKPHAHDLVSWAVELGQLMEALAEAQVSGEFPEDLSAAYGGSRGFPRLHCGVLALQEDDPTDGVTGYPVSQPLINLDGEEQLLDDAIGQRFAIISAEPLEQELSAAHRDLLERIDAKLLCLPQESRCTPELDHLLGLHRAVIVRPDRHVFGLVNAEHSLAEQLDKLQIHF